MELSGFLRSCCAESSPSREHSLVYPAGKMLPLFSRALQITLGHAVRCLDPSTVFSGCQGCILGQAGEFGELGESQGREFIATTKWSGTNFLSLCMIRCCQRGPGLSPTLGMPMEGIQGRKILPRVLLAPAADRRRLPLTADHGRNRSWKCLVLWIQTSLLFLTGNS